MFRILLIASLLVCSLGSSFPSRPQPINSRLKGGEDASIREIPYQAGLILSGTFICGGSILSERVIVTSGRCSFYGSASAWTVHVGSETISGGQKSLVTNIILHENYDDYNIDYDIALFFLATPIFLDNTTTKAIELPAQGAPIPEGTVAITSGWGATATGIPMTLQKLSITVANQEDCAANYASIEWFITERMICAANSQDGIDASIADKGGPLVFESVLIGITSFGLGYERATFPGIWTRVPALVDWITQNMAV